MIYSLYTTLLTLGLVLSSPYFALKILATHRYRRGLSQRLGISYKSVGERVGNEQPLWIHAASVGEVLGSLPIIEGIRQTNPKLPILLSTMTATGNDIAKKRAPDTKAITFFPLDHPWAVRKAISLVNPRAFLMAETEIWPNFLMELGRRKIHVLLFNGRISSRSLQWYKRFRFFLNSPLAAISAFCMQSSLDAQRIIEIGANPERVIVTGNIKFDQTPPKITPGEKEALRETLSLQADQPILIAGSTHRGEEQFMLKVYRQLSPDYPDLVLILAPRHLERMREVEILLKREKIAWKRRSQLRPGGNRGEVKVILLDTLGELAKLYSIGTLIFVGGSLVRVGGHNVLEPLFFKKPVLFGPFMFNFLEISRRLIEAEGAIQVKDREDLAFQMKRLLRNERARKQLGERGYQFLQKHQGATERMYEKIRPYLE